MNLQVSLQEKAQQHKETVEDSARLRLELQRLSDDRDQLANQVHRPFPILEFLAPPIGLKASAASQFGLGIQLWFKRVAAAIITHDRERDV